MIFLLAGSVFVYFVVVPIILVVIGVIKAIFTAVTK
jgi:hypothetical protein